MVLVMSSNVVQIVEGKKTYFILYIYLSMFSNKRLKINEFAFFLYEKNKYPSFLIILYFKEEFQF